MSAGEATDDISTRAKGFLLVLVAYVAALGVGTTCAVLLDGQGLHPLALAALVDLAGTLTIFAFSRTVNNSSVYDAYWSVAPPALGAYWLTMPEAGAGIAIRQVLAMALVGVWGLRLTFNWARHWSGLAHEDWRYVDLRHKTGKGYWVVSLLGLHLFPTVQVFLGCLALYAALVGGRGLSWLDLLGVVLLCASIWLEARADRELHAFRSTTGDKSVTLDRGVWSLCRHPNYLGEMGIWWGLACLGFGALGFQWWIALGAVTITAMFVGISIPMKEARMKERRDDWDAYTARVPLLLPMPWSRSRSP